MFLKALLNVTILSLGIRKNRIYNSKHFPLWETLDSHDVKICIYFSVKKTKIKSDFPIWESPMMESALHSLIEIINPYRV